MLPIISDLIIDQHTLYHVSPKRFDFPCRKQINEARAWSPWHGNGVLGLWTSTFPKLCKSFGSNVYQVDLKPTARRIGLPFGAFHRLTSEMEDFTDLIAYLYQRGDVAYLVDANPFVGEVIILNFDQIETFIDVTNQDLHDIKHLMRAQ